MADKTQNVKTRLSFDGEAEYKAACKEINSTLKVLNSEMKLVTAEYKDNASSVDALKAKQAVLQKTYDEQAKKVKETEAALEKCRKATGDNSEESKKLETQLNYQKAALVKTEQELGKTTDEMEKAEKAADEMGKEIKDSGEQADDAKGKFSGFTSVLSGMGTALKAAAAATAAAVAGAATAIGALTTKAIEGYAAQEQLVGGVETLFKTSSDTVVGYANDAYKTAGMSANEYMETVTSFSASLLASMNNDTAAAAEKANVAITDMSDNGIDFVGYKHRATHRKVRKDSIKRIKRTIKKCESGKITKEQLQKSIQSWTGHAGHADSYNLRKKIETLAEAAIGKAA